MASFISGNVRANCPDCGGAVTTYEFKQSGAEFGTIVSEGDKAIYKLLRCASCGRGGLATVLKDPKGQSYLNGSLIDFYPPSISALPLPDSVPEGVMKEFREAELCASVKAWRAASALMRSVLEKTLKENGYKEGSLAAKIDAAAADGVITESRSKRAHDEVRVLGNDVLHDEWREVSEEEFHLAHRYAQRVLEDFYDDRPSVTSLLISKKRLPAP